jgi:hypothetical protein
MKIALTMAAIAALVAAAAWAVSCSRPTGPFYTVEVRDVAGLRSLVVSPAVMVTAPRFPAMSEVVARANLMPEVVVRAPAAPEYAGEPGAGLETAN